MSKKSRTWKPIELGRAADVTAVRVRQLCEAGRLAATRTPDGRWVIPDAAAQAFLRARRARVRADEAMASVAVGAV